MFKPAPPMKHPAELAQALQRKYDGIKDFSADFVHAYQGGVLRKQITERGRAADQEARQDAVGLHGARGEAVRLRRREDVFLHPAGQAGHRRAVPPDDEATTPALFLAGKGNLTRDFTPSLVDVPAGMRRRHAGR